ncbi:MAG: class II aldolase/adducin family protein [Burkholderiaceae bacterium]|nr:class II aldolase/adducin family protein [Burkholderiaceae bacterium]
MSEHAELRAQLVREAQRLQPLGLATGTSGNLSVRVQIDGADGMLITPSGQAYETLTPESIVPLRFSGPGTADWPDHQLPSSEWLMHQAVYQARPEAGAVVHGHPEHATVLAIQGLAIPAIHYMIAAAGGPTIRCAPYATFGTAALSQAAVAALAGRKACLLEHHGLLAFERDLAKAMWLAREVETLAQQYLMLLPIAGPAGPRLLPDDEIERVLEKFKTYGLRPAQRPG